MNNCYLTPHGVSGLKSYMARSFPPTASSHPTRGEWVEIRSLTMASCGTMFHPTRGEWIEK